MNKCPLGWRIALLASAIIIAAAEADSLSAQRSLDVIDRMPRGLPQFFSSEPNSKAKADFGRFLFFSPLLARGGEKNCSSCHVPSLSFSGPVPNDVIIGGLTLRRMPPPLINLYNGRRFMWDGRAVELVNQVRLPLETKGEMDIDWPQSLRGLESSPATVRYLSAVGRSSATQHDVYQSLAEFISRLVTTKSSFDRFFFDREASAIELKARKGFELFSGKAKCSGCHLISGDFALFTDNSFHVIGAGNDQRDLGRFVVTRNPADMGAFKTPTLRNVSRRKAYMHDGSMRTLREVLEFYNRGGNREVGNLDEKIVQLHLSDAELEELAAFLDTLSSDVAILDNDK